MIKTAKIPSSRHAELAQAALALEATTPGFADVWAELRGHLLAAGGEDVVPGVRNIASVRELLAGAKMITPGSVTVARVARRSVLENSLVVWLENNGQGTVCRGYALSGDGLWREHTWLQEDGRIVDATAAHLAYFGTQLGTTEAAAMYLDAVKGGHIAGDDETVAALGALAG